MIDTLENHGNNFRHFAYLHSWLGAEWSKALKMGIATQQHSVFVFAHQLLGGREI